MGPVSIGVEVQRNTDGDTPSNHSNASVAEYVDAVFKCHWSFRSITILASNLYIILKYLTYNFFLLRINLNPKFTHDKHL